MIWVAALLMVGCTHNDDSTSVDEPSGANYTASIDDEITRVYAFPNGEVNLHKSLENIVVCISG